MRWVFIHSRKSPKEENLHRRYLNVLIPGHTQFIELFSEERESGVQVTDPRVCYVGWTPETQST